LRAEVGCAENRGTTFIHERRDSIDRRLSIARYVVDFSIVHLLLLSIDIIWARHIFRRRRSKKIDGTKRSAGGSGRNAGKGDQQHYNFLHHFTFPELLRLTLYFGQGRDKSFAAISYGNAYRWRASSCWPVSVKPQYLSRCSRPVFRGLRPMQSRHSRTVC